MNEAQLVSQPITAIKDKLAAWLSTLLDSSVIAVPISLGAAWSEVGTFLPALGWAALALLFADGVPLTYISLGMRFGWVSGFDLPRREERAPFIAVNLIGNLPAGLLSPTRAERPCFSFGVVVGVRRAGRHDDDHLLLLEDQPARGRGGRLRGFPDLDVWPCLGADFSSAPPDRLGASLSQTA